MCSIVLSRSRSFSESFSCWAGSATNTSQMFFIPLGAAEGAEFGFPFSQVWKALMKHPIGWDSLSILRAGLVKKNRILMQFKSYYFCLGRCWKGESFFGGCFGLHSEHLAELLEEDSPECEAHLVTAALEFLRFVYTKPVATHQLTVQIPLPWFWFPRRFLLSGFCPAKLLVSVSACLSNFWISSLFSNPVL